jgi:hypothetical protein
MKIVQRNVGRADASFKIEICVAKARETAMDRRYHDCKPSRHSVGQSFIQGRAKRSHRWVQNLPGGRTSGMLLEGDQTHFIETALAASAAGLLDGLMLARFMRVPMIVGYGIRSSGRYGRRYRSWSFASAREGGCTVRD